MDTWRIKAKENITKHNKKKSKRCIVGKKQCLGVRRSVLLFKNYATSRLLFYCMSEILEVLGGTVGVY